MQSIAKKLFDYRELTATLAWKDIALRRKQTYLCTAPGHPQTLIS